MTASNQDYLSVMRGMHSRSIPPPPKKIKTSPSPVRSISALPTSTVETGSPTPPDLPVPVTSISSPTTRSPNGKCLEVLPDSLRPLKKRQRLFESIDKLDLQVKEPADGVTNSSILVNSAPSSLRSSTSIPPLPTSSLLVEKILKETTNADKNIDLKREELTSKDVPKVPEDLPRIASQLDSEKNVSSGVPAPPSLVSDSIDSGDPSSPEPKPKPSLSKPLTPTKEKSLPRPSIKHSDTVVRSSIEKYKNYFHVGAYDEKNEDSDCTTSSHGSGVDETFRVQLEYPKNGISENFLLLKPVIAKSKNDEEDKDEYNPITDLIRSAEIMAEYYLSPEQAHLLGDENQGILRHLNKYRNKRDGPNFIKAVQEFNKVMKTLKEDGSILKNVRKMGPPPFDLVCHILHQVYSRTVAPHADSLNQYTAFSNNVYGEILPNLTNEFIKKTGITEKNVFVDLGCGIGNVVLQVAAQTGCESHGIEIMETPCKLAKLQLKEYAARMRAWNLPTGSVRIKLGDFRESPDLNQVLRRADVILVNNYAFSATLNQQLSLLFLDLKDGCKVISLKSFVPVGHKITERNAHSPESILSVEKFQYWSEAVSWTHAGGQYYIATVDRTAVRLAQQTALRGGRTTRSRR